MNDSIAYWVGCAEMAAEMIELCASHGWLAQLDKAQAAHKEACENLMRIASAAHVYFPVNDHPKQTRTCKGKFREVARTNV